jgi:hypothetical protein
MWQHKWYLCYYMLFGGGGIPAQHDTWGLDRQR